MEIRSLTTETVEWDAFVRSSAHGSPFHLLAWKRVVEAAFGHRPHYLLAVGSDRVEGVLPLFMDTVRCLLRAPSTAAATPAIMTRSRSEESVR